MHTDIGNNCIACRIDRHLAPLSTRLESGQTLEIITAPGARPNLSWLNFVTTAKARSAIRHALKHQQQTEAVMLGRRLLNKALAPFNTSLEELDPTVLTRAFDQLDVASEEALLESLGLGNRVAHVVARRLVDVSDGHPSELVNEGTSHKAVMISGGEGMVINYARCCHPLPGDTVVGHLSMGKGLVVHRAECKNLADRDDPDKVFALEWSEHIDEDFPVALRIEIESRRGWSPSLPGWSLMPMPTLSALASKSATPA